MIYGAWGGSPPKRDSKGQPVNERQPEAVGLGQARSGYIISTGLQSKDQYEHIPTVSQFMQQSIDRMGDRMEKMKQARDTLRKAGLADMNIVEFRELFGNVF